MLSREGFYKTLSNLGVLSGLEMTLQSSVKVDIFSLPLFILVPVQNLLKGTIGTYCPPKLRDVETAFNYSYY